MATMNVTELYAELFGNRSDDDYRLNAEDVRFRFCVLNRFFQDEAQRAVAILQDDLRNEDPAVRISAAECLGLLGESVEESLEVLSDALHCFQGDCRLRAVQTLGLLGRAAAPVAPQLLESIRFPDEPLLLEALHALRLIHPPATEAVEPLLDFLAATSLRDFALQTTASDVLVSYGRAVAPFVVDRLADLAAGERAWSYARILERIGWLPQEAAPTLLRSLANRSAWRSSLVVSLFAPSDGVEAFFWFDHPFEVIRLGLADADILVRRLAAEALSYSDAPAKERLPLLLELAGDSEDSLRELAFTQLLMLTNEMPAATPEVVKVFQDALHSETGSFRDLAGQYLHLLEPPPAEELMPEIDKGDATTHTAAVAPDPENVRQTLSEVVDHKMARLYDLKIRQIFNGMSYEGLRQSWPSGLFHFFRAIASSDRNAALAAMRRALDSTCQGTAINACRLLWELRHDAAEVVPTLDRILRTLTPRYYPGDANALADCLEAVAACTELLAGIGPPAAGVVAVLRLLLKDSYWLYKRYAAETLGCIGPAAASAIPDLIETIAFENPWQEDDNWTAAEFRRAAVVAVCKILNLGPAVEAAFLEVESNPYVRARICHVLQDLNPEIIAAILETIQDRYGGSGLG